MRRISSSARPRRRPTTPPPTRSRRTISCSARGAEILFHALGCGVIAERAGEIVALVLETKSGRCAVRGKIFIDCSGDGDLAAWAGARFERGDADGNLLYPTAMFRLNGVDPRAAGEAWSAIPRLMEEAERRGARFPRKGAIVRPMTHPQEWRVNVTQIKRADGKAVDGTDADELSAGEIEGRRQVRAFFEFLKREAPGFGESYIVDIPPQIGIRETRRVNRPLPAQRRRRDVVRELRRHRRRQWLADRGARGGRRGVALARHPGLARVQTTLPIACWSRRGRAICWWRAAAPR